MSRPSALSPEERTKSELLNEALVEPKLSSSLFT